MKGGWRRLNIAGCDADGADLIESWREAHDSKDSILTWHEGQLRANAGQTARAVALFERSRKTEHDDHGLGWNLYVDGTIAFLRRDRAGLEQARCRLAALPRPASFAPKDAGGRPMNMLWPINLSVLDGFLTCWGQTYRAAYDYAKPLFTVTRP